MRKTIWLIATAGAALMTTNAAAQAVSGVPLIERAKLFGNPTRTGGQ